MSFFDASRLSADGPNQSPGSGNDRSRGDRSSDNSSRSPALSLGQSPLDRSDRRLAHKTEQLYQQLRRNEQFILHPGQLWQIESGFMRALTWDDQGLVCVLGLWGPGDCLALPFSNVQPYQLDCLRPTRLQRLSLEQTYPYEFVYAQAQRLEELLCLSRVRALDLRVLKTLRWLARRFGKPERGSWQVGVPLTHQELAELVGSTRVSITRILQQLQRSGQLHCDGRQWVLASSSDDRRQRPREYLQK